MGFRFAGSGDEQRAIECLRHVLVTEPTSVEARVELAPMLAQRGQFDEAQELLESAWRMLEPGDARASTVEKLLGTLRRERAKQDG